MNEELETQTEVEILPELITAFEIPEERALIVRSKFDEFFNSIKEWNTKAENLVLSGIEDKKGMEFAKETRIYIKNKRLFCMDIIKESRADVKKRMESELKEDKFYLKLGQEIEKLAKEIESKFEDKEKFAERLETERKQKLKAERIADLSDLAEFVPMGLDLAEITEDDYKRLLNGAKAQKILKDEEKQREENQRIEEKKQRDELLRRRELFFNAGFKFHDFQFIYSEIRIPWEHIEKIGYEEFQELYQRAINIKNEIDAKQLRNQSRVSKLISLGMKFTGTSYNLNIDDKSESCSLSEIDSLSDDDFAIKFQFIKSFKENADEELKQKTLKEIKEKARIQAEKDAEIKAKKEAEDAELKAKNAPDKEKLLAFAEIIGSIKIPEVSGEYAQKIMSDVSGLLSKTANYIITKTENL